MKSSKNHVQVANVTQLAQHFDCSREQIARLEKQGVIERLADGDGFDLDQSRIRYLRHLRERKSTGGRSRERYDAARAAREEMKAQQLAGTLCKTSDFDEAWTLVIGAVLSRLEPADPGDARSCAPQDV
jgi:hypothetical protein